MCFSTPDTKVYNVVLNGEFAKDKADEVAQAINVLTNFDYEVAVVEEKQD